MEVRGRKEEMVRGRKDEKPWEKEEKASDRRKRVARRKERAFRKEVKQGRYTREYGQVTSVMALRILFGVEAAMRFASLADGMLPD